MLKERFLRGLKRSKAKIIFAVALLLVMSLFVIAPLSVAVKNSMTEEGFDMSAFFAEKIGEVTSNYVGSMFTAFTFEYIGAYWSLLWKGTIIISIAMAMGFSRAFPKNEYGDIEHGSSDWCLAGEQYSILNKSKGLILAEKNYLPVDKRGNVNVLVVGRFRFW